MCERVCMLSGTIQARQKALRYHAAWGWRQVGKTCIADQAYTDCQESYKKRQRFEATSYHQATTTCCQLFTMQLPWD